MSNSSALQVPKTGKGWYPDPFSGGEKLRYFDGKSWTDKEKPLPNSTSEAPKENSPTQTGFSTPTVTADKKEESPFAKPEAPFAAPKVPQAPQKEEDAPAFEAPKTPQEPAQQSFSTPAFSTPADTTDTPAVEEPVVPAFSFSKKVEDTPVAPAPQNYQADNEDPWGVVSDPEDQGIDEHPGQDVSFLDEESTLEDSWGSEPAPTRRKSSKKFVPSVTLDQKWWAWIAVAALTIVMVLLAFVAPTPTTNIARECTPISKTVTKYSNTENYTLDDEDKAYLAAALAAGDLNHQVSQIVQTAGAENSAKPIIQHCMPSTN